MMGKGSAASRSTTTRYAYVQSDRIWGKGGGISLQDLRDIVESTADYAYTSRVILTPNKVEVIETFSTHWKYNKRKEAE